MKARSYKLTNSSDEQEQRICRQQPQQSFQQLTQQLQSIRLANQNTPILEQYNLRQLLHQTQLSKVILLEKKYLSGKTQQQQEVLHVIKISPSASHELKILRKLAVDYFSDVFDTLLPKNYLTRGQQLSDKDAVQGFIMPFYEQTLRKILLKCKFGLANQSIIRLLKDLLSGLCELHSKRIVHGDLKPQNIVYSTTENKYKIIDLGNSFQLLEGTDKISESKLPTQTVQYRCPQAIFERGNQSIDIWSLGCILFECLTGNPLISNEVSQQREIYQYFKCFQNENQWNLAVKFNLKKWVPSLKQVQPFLELLYKMLTLSCVQRGKCRDLLEELIEVENRSKERLMQINDN